MNENKAIWLAISERKRNGCNISCRAEKSKLG